MASFDGEQRWWDQFDQQQEFLSLRDARASCPLLSLLGLVDCSISDMAGKCRHHKDLKQIFLKCFDLCEVVCFFLFHLQKNLAESEEGETEKVEQEGHETAANDSVFLFDPYVKDSRCQTQALYIFCSGLSLRSQAPVLNQLALRRALEFFVEQRERMAPLLMQFNHPLTEDQLGSLRRDAMEIFHTLSFQQALLAESSSWQIKRLQMMLVYMLLSLCRQHNQQFACFFDAKTPFFLFAQKILSIKRVHRSLVRSGKHHTHQLELFMFNKHQTLVLAGKVPYFASFLSCFMEWSSLQIPILVFIQYQCSSHQENAQDHLVPFALQFESGTPPIAAPLEAVLVPSRLSRYSPPVMPPTFHIAVTGIQKIAGPCALLDRIRAMEGIDFTQILFSYAAQHETLPPAFFQCTPGTAKEDSSLFLIEHVFCLKGDHLPKWQRKKFSS